MKAQKNTFVSRKANPANETTLSESTGIKTVEASKVIEAETPKVETPREAAQAVELRIKHRRYQLTDLNSIIDLAVLEGGRFRSRAASVNVHGTEIRQAGGGESILSLPARQSIVKQVLKLGGFGDSKSPSAIAKSKQVIGLDLILAGLETLGFKV